MFKNSYLITGGTGSFGKKFLEKILNNKKVGRVVVYSRDEFKQSQLQAKYPKSKFPLLRFFLGDVRDYDRLNFALKSIENVVHAAALKQVPSTEYNPFEAIKTNIIGAQNLIMGCLQNKVKKVVALSTDKACAPINLYGATKLCSDKLFISANNIKGNNKIKFSVVRYGNVFGSRGSVFNVFKNFEKKDFFPVTDKKMTRFNITLDEGVDNVLFCIKNCKGGEIFVPKLSSFRIIDLAKAMDSKKKIKEIGIRSGEKIHEQMITPSDSYNTLDCKNFYVILSQDTNKLESFYKQKFKSKKVPKGFEYSSNLNSNYLNINQLKKLINDH